MNFSQLQKKKRQAVKNKNTPPEVREALRLELLGKCEICRTQGIETQAVHDRFGRPLCNDCNTKVQEKIDELKKNKQEQDAKNNANADMREDA